MELVAQFTLAALVFVSTNIDDIFLLAAFFADKRLSIKAVVTGQCLGISGLILASTLIAWMSIALPAGWISLLGLVPLYLGLSQIKAIWTATDEEAEDSAIQLEERQLERGFHSQILAVAGVTVANGGDNLGVYIPMFASSFSAIPLFVSVFAVMTLVWCALGYVLVSNRIFGHLIRRYGHKILPVVLIVLGLDILSGALVLLS